jgi:hypothetical protein
MLANYYTIGEVVQEDMGLKSSDELDCAVDKMMELWCEHELGPLTPTAKS